MAEIIDLPDHAKTRAAHRKLANWLRELADIIEADSIETEPHAALIVLTGTEQHEVLCAGYGSDGHGAQGAAYAAQTVMTTSYRTEGQNIRPRDWLQYGGLLRQENIVDFTPVARKPE